MTRSTSSWANLEQLGPSAWLALAAAFGVTAGLAFDRTSSPLILLALAAGGAVAAVILAKPEVGLLVLVFTTYTNLSTVLITFHGAPSIAKVMAPLILLAVLLRWARMGQPPEGWVQPALLVVVYGFACTLSLFSAQEPALTLEGLNSLAKNFLIVLCVVTLLQSGASLRRVAWALIAAAIFMGTISVHQQLTGKFDFDYWGFGRTPVGFSFDGERTIRLSGPIGHPNFYGMIFLAIVPLAIDRLQLEVKPIPRVLALWALLVSVFSIVFTYSRSALVSLIALLGMLVLVRQPRPRHLLATAILFLAFVPFLPSGYTHRLAELADSVVEITESGTTREISVRGRLSENLVAVNMFLDHPIVGVGFGNYPARYQEYARELDLDPRTSDRAAHNLYLELLSETGLIGFAAFGLLIWVALSGALEARGNLFRAGRRNSARLVEAFTLSFVGYLIASFFLHASHPRYLWLLIGIALALSQVAKAELSGEPATTSS